MRIPRHITINKAKWRISLDSKKLDTTKYDGMCIHDDREILIDPSLPRNEMEKTILHELLHSAWPDNICSLRKEETIVETLASILSPVIRQLYTEKRKNTSGKKKKTNRKHG